MRQDWINCQFKDIAKIRNGYAFKSKDFKKTKELENDIPLIKQSQLNGDSVDLASAVYLPYEYLEKYKNYILNYGDVLIGMSGSIGKLCIYNQEFPSLQNQRTGKIEELASGQIANKFFWLYLQTVEAKLSEMSKGVGVQNVSGKTIEELPLSLPPLLEQKAIVAKIEQLFSELDNGIANLKTAQAKLKIYRQAVLKKAFEGELTCEWREKQTNLPTADELLEQIKREREVHYKQQLEEWKQAVKEWEENSKNSNRPTKPRRLDDPKEISEDELEQLSKLPSIMSWVRLGQILWSVKDGPHYSPKYSQSGIPFISGGNIRPNGIDFENVKYISTELHQELSKRCKPQLNDVLYTKGGTTGIARVNTYDIDFNVWVHVAVLKTINMIEPFYLQHALNAHHCYKQSQQYTHGVGNQDLGLTRMVLITLPICSKEEQKQIVREIETRLSVCDKIEETITNSLAKSEALRQSILKKAFEGKLLSEQELQNIKNHPDFESAEELIKRIKKERSK